MSRWRVMIWLDDQIKDELQIGQEVLALKQKRKFRRTVIDGIRLILSLRKGDTSVLKELFPLIVAQIEYEMIVHEREEGGGGNDDNEPDVYTVLDEIKKAQAEMNAQLAEQNRKIIPLFGNDGKLLMAGEKPSGAAGQGSTIKKSLVLPTFDDDEDDTLVMNKVTNKATGANLMNSIFELH